MKKLSKFNLFTMVYGSTIGSGIFLMIGFAIGNSGRSLPLAVLLGAIYITLANLFSYIITSFVPLAGGTYDHIAFVGMPTFSGVMGLSTLLSATMIGGFSTGIFDYLSAVFPALAPYSKALAILLILAFFAVSAYGMDATAKLQNVITIILIVSLLLFGIIGITKVDLVAYVTEPGFFRAGGKGFIAAAALMAFTCSGGEGTGFALAKDIEHPTRNVPRITMLAVFAAVATYMLMSIVAAGVLPIEQVENQPLTVVAQTIFSRPMFIVFVIGGAVFALLTSMNGFIAGLRYPLESVADDGWLPAFLNKKTKSGYPYVLMILSALLAIIPILFNISFDTIVTLVSLSTLPLFIYANAACIALPKKYPNLWKKSIFHMPYPVYAVLMVVATACSAYYAYSYLVDYDYSFWLLAAVVIGALYLLCWLRVKTGGVDKEAMLEKKRKIAEEITAADFEN